MKRREFLGNVTGGLAALNLVGRPLISWAGPKPIDFMNPLEGGRTFESVFR